MNRLLLIMIVVALGGCIPDVPAIPTGATCTQEGLILRPVTDNVTSITDLQFVLDEQGAPMTCVFTY